MYTPQGECASWSSWDGYKQGAVSSVAGPKSVFLKERVCSCILLCMMYYCVMTDNTYSPAATRGRRSKTVRRRAHKGKVIIRQGYASPHDKHLCLRLPHRGGIVPCILLPAPFPWQCITPHQNPIYCYTTHRLHPHNHHRNDCTVCAGYVKGTFPGV